MMRNPNRFLSARCFGNHPRLPPAYGNLDPSLTPERGSHMVCEKVRVRALLGACENKR